MLLIVLLLVSRCSLLWFLFQVLLAMLLFSFGCSLLCFFFWVLFTKQHYGHSSSCCCLLCGAPHHASACFWALLTMLVFASRRSFPWFFSWHSSPCYYLLLSIPCRDVDFGHSLMCCRLLLGVLCHVITSRPPHYAITSRPPYCIITIACTRWSCCSRFQGSQFSFPIQLTFIFLFFALFVWFLFRCFSWLLCFCRIISNQPIARIVL